MTSMDYYTLDKHCPQILSPLPVISSTSCIVGGGSNGGGTDNTSHNNVGGGGNNLIGSNHHHHHHQLHQQQSQQHHNPYLNGNGSSPVTATVPSSSSSSCSSSSTSSSSSPYQNGSQTDHDGSGVMYHGIVDQNTANSAVNNPNNTNNVINNNDKITTSPDIFHVTDTDTDFGISSYYNLDNHSQQAHHHHQVHSVSHHHQNHQAHQHHIHHQQPSQHHHHNSYDDLTKAKNDLSGGSTNSTPTTPTYHHMQPTYMIDTNYDSVTGTTASTTSPMFSQSLQPSVGQSSPPVLTAVIPDSPSLIDVSHSHHIHHNGYHQHGHHATPSLTQQPPPPPQTSAQTVKRNGLYIAKKSTSPPSASSSSSSSSTASSSPPSSVVSYELKREMAESSGLSPCGTPYHTKTSSTTSNTNNSQQPPQIHHPHHHHRRKAGSYITNGDSSNTTATASAATTTNPQSFTDADSNSGNPSQSKAFVPCKVCGDKASGYHYGVTSCEGCKGFFRRSIQKQIEYRCLRDGKCLIIRLNRNRCQYCRFKKCLAVGMSRDSVRYGRVPKKSKEKERMDEKRVTQAEADQSSNGDSESKDLACYEITLTISQAHHDNCSYTNEKIKGINKKPIFLLSSQLKNSETCSSPDIGSVSESLEAQKIELWEHLALLITPCIQRVVEFAKRIPGFSDLTQDDQLILIKLGFFEVWLVHISKTVDFVENTLTFADGSFLSRRQLELMFNHEFVGNLFHLMTGLTNLNLTDEEVALFSAIIILQPDRPQIYDVKAISKIQESIIAALKFQINKHRENENLQTFHKLIMKINELRALGSSHSLHLQWFRTNWSRLKLPPLFAEIFDIPKLSSFNTQQQTSNNNNNNNDSTNNNRMLISPLTAGNSPGPQVQIQPATTTQTIIKTEPFETNTGSIIDNGAQI